MVFSNWCCNQELERMSSLKSARCHTGCVKRSQMKVRELFVFWNPFLTAPLWGSTAHHTTTGGLKLTPSFTAAWQWRMTMSTLPNTSPNALLGVHDSLAIEASMHFKLAFWTSHFANDDWDQWMTWIQSGTQQENTHWKGHIHWVSETSNSWHCSDENTTVESDFLHSPQLLT